LRLVHRRARRLCLRRAGAEAGNWVLRRVAAGTVLVRNPPAWVRTATVGITRKTGNSYTDARLFGGCRSGLHGRRIKRGKQLRPFCPSGRPIGTPPASIPFNENQVGPLPPARSSYPLSRPPDPSTRASSFPQLLASSFSRPSFAVQAEPSPAPQTSLEDRVPAAHCPSAQPRAEFACGSPRAQCPRARPAPGTRRGGRTRLNAAPATVMNAARLTVCSAASNGPDDEKRLHPRHDRLGQQNVRR